MLGFETLTLAPIARDLIDLRLLRPDEIAWLDAYHARVRKTLAAQARCVRTALAARRDATAAVIRRQRSRPD